MARAILYRYAARVDAGDELDGPDYDDLERIDELEAEEAETDPDAAGL